MFQARFFVIFSILVFASSAAAQEVGELVHVEGTATIVNSQGASRAAAPGMRLQVGDSVSTGAAGLASLLLADETLVRLHNRTVFTLREVRPSAAWLKRVSASTASGSEYRVEQGRAWFRNKRRAAGVRVNTPTVSASIRGTEFLIDVVDSDTTLVTVLTGVIEAENALGSVTAVSAEQIRAQRGEVLTKRLLLEPENAVQWVLEIPTVFPRSLQDRIASSPSRGGLLRALTLIEAGDISDAASALQEYIEGPGAQDKEAWTLRSVLSLVLGEAHESLAHAEKVVAAEPNSAHGHIALGYAHQALFDLDRAEAAYRKAVEVGGLDELAKLRLSDILLGKDDSASALELVNSVLDVSPDSAAAHERRGFLFLSELDTDAALASFERALALSSNRADAYLGMAIAKMRKGEEEQAIEAISKAVLLEPRRSVFLSYWGKLLYEMEREERALELFTQASELDPRDPTPQLYRAIALRDLNRPSEALRALNKAFALNDNRAVYRSRFLLDKDAAVANVNLANVYDDLGLSEWARAKAIDSIKRDYRNPSAHRFLANAYRDARSRTEAANQEFVLRDILSEANNNTFATGADFTVFYEQPEGEATVSGDLGSFDSQSGNVQLTGGLPEQGVAGLAEVNRRITDGRDAGLEEEETRTVGQVKWALTNKDSVFLEFNSQDNERGFNSQSLIDAPIDSFDRLRENGRLVQGVYRRKLTPKSDFFLSFHYTDFDRERRIRGFGSATTSEGDEIPILRVTNRDIQNLEYSTQAQYIGTHGDHQLIAGTIQFWGNEQGDRFREFFLPEEFGGGLIDEELVSNDQDERYESYYLYDIWNVTRWLTLDMAIQYDYLEDASGLAGTLDTNSAWSPRFGAIIRPTDYDTIRVAAFQSLQAYSAIGRFDPTDIAGIPIIANEFFLTRTREFALQYEREWNTGFALASWNYRDRQLPFTPTLGAETDDINSYEHEASIAINQILLENLGFSARYSFLNGTATLGEALPDDHFADARLSYRGPSGLIARGEQFFRYKDPIRDKGISVTNATLGWELPRKRGVLFVSVQNIFDKEFNYTSRGQTVTNVSFEPARTWLIGAQLIF